MKLRRTSILLALAAISFAAHATETTADSAPLSSLHIAITDGRIDPWWSGASPGLRTGDLTVNAFVLNPDKRTMLLTVAEQHKPGRELNVNVVGARTDLSLRTPAENRGVALRQDDDGISLAINGAPPLKAKTFHDLVMEHTSEVQVNVLRPLADLGATIDLSPDIPVVMAAATSGYAEADATTAETVKKLTAELASPDEAAREKASGALKKVFPLAIKTITDLAKATSDPELKARLDAVIAAHPGIAKARAYVEQNGLQNDRKYLESIASESPLLREAARMRLAAIQK